jgi:hypothetical protein
MFYLSQNIQCLLPKCFLLLSWLYSAMWAFASLMDPIQSSLFFDLCSQFMILHFLISPCTQSHHLDLGLSLGQLPWGWLAKTWYTILLLSILLTWPIHLNLFILINETISKSPYNCISSLLRHLLQQLLISVKVLPPRIVSLCKQRFVGFSSTGCISQKTNVISPKLDNCAETVTKTFRNPK